MTNPPSSDVALSKLLGHAEWLQRLARSLVTDRSAADDAVQDTWLAALKHGRPTGGARAWLASILRNVVRQNARSETARRAREQRVARGEQQPSGEDSVERAQIARRLIEALLELDEPYRSTLLLHYQDGHSSAAIARMHAVPESTVRNRVRRGLELLRERFERRDGAGWALLLVPVAEFAHRAPRATTFSIPLLAGLAMKKVVLIAAACACIAALVWWSASRSAVSAPSNAVALKPSALDAVRAQPAAASSDERREAELAPPTAAHEVVAASGSPMLVVRVVWDVDGSPAAGIGVHAIPWRAAQPFLAQREALTDVRGVVEFDRLAAGRCAVGVDRAGGEHVDLVEGETREIELWIERGVDIDGIVVDERGSGVSGARVWLSAYANAQVGQEVTSTDADGRFHLRDVGEARYVAARADGYAPSYAYDVHGQPGDRVEMKLVLPARGGAIRGAVRDFTGAPAAGAILCITTQHQLSLPDAYGRSLSQPPPAYVVCDEHGRFAFDGLVEGAVRVEARTLSSAPASVIAQVRVRETTELAIELEPGASVVGTITSAAGAPVRDVFVGVGAYAEFASSMTRTSDDGTFRLDGLDAGEIEIRADSPVHGAARERIATTASVVTRWDVQLGSAAGRTVAGHVVDERGAPLAGWRVGAIARGQEGLHLRTCLTGEDGSFAFARWPEEADALEVREAERWVGPPCLFETDVRIGATDHVLRVADDARATAYFTGRVFGPDGKPAPQARLLAKPAGFSITNTVDISSTTGEFRIGPFPAGEYELGADAPTLGKIALGPRTLHARERLDLGEIRFQRPGRIRLRIELDAGCDAPKKWFVNLHELDGTSVPATSLDGLDWRSAPLAPREYVAELGNVELMSREQRIDVAPGAEVEVVLAAQRATYRVVDLAWSADSIAPDRLEYDLRDANGALLRTTKLPFLDTPCFLVRDLVPGSYQLDLRVNENRSAHLAFDVASFERPLDRLRVELR